MKKKNNDSSSLVRCKWCNMNNSLYVEYHDKEWGKINLDDKYLYEMLILESFQAGLSWECVLNKRDNFRNAYDNFDLEKVVMYGEDKINDLLANDGIIRNRRKVEASIRNSKVYREIVGEFGSFRAYLEKFTGGKVYYEVGATTNELSDEISSDLRKRGMSFVGSVIIYSYLQAVGIINSHDEGCFLYKKDIVSVD